MDKNERIERIKESKRKYGNVYNKTNVGVQLNRDLINLLKDKLKGEVTLKHYLEELIRKEL